MINLKNIKDIIDQIFSDSGYSVNSVNIQFPQPLDIKITKDGESISLDFVGNTPKISWKRFITLSARIDGISLNKDGGTLKLKYLPDIDFSYEKTQEALFGQSYNFEEIKQEIYNEFSDDARQKLANRCLQYGVEWATIASQSSKFCNASISEQKILKQQCKAFIKSKIAEEEKCGSAILTFILIYVLLPVVLKFIVERIFRKIFE